jgi:ethanolamine utilization protein EutN
MPASSGSLIIGRWQQGPVMEAGNELPPGRAGRKSRLSTMILARVIGEVVSTHKRPQFEGASLLLVQPETPTGEKQGTPLLAIDSVGSGRGELVIVVLEGRAAQEALGKKLAPVDAAILGIVDELDIHE